MAPRALAAPSPLPSPLFALLIFAATCLVYPRVQLSIPRFLVDATCLVFPRVQLFMPYFIVDAVLLFCIGPFIFLDVF